MVGTNNVPLPYLITTMQHSGIHPFSTTLSLNQILVGTANCCNAQLLCVVTSSLCLLCRELVIASDLSI